MRTVEVARSIGGLGTAGDIIQFDDADPRWQTYLDNGWLVPSEAPTPPPPTPTDLVGPLAVAQPVPTITAGMLSVTIDGAPYRVAIYPPT